MPAPTRRSVALARALRITALVAAAACIACSGSPTEAGDGNGLRVRAERGELVLNNRTFAPVFTTVLGSPGALLVDWVACADATRCPPLAPGATMRVSYPSNPRDGTPARDAVVYWWHAERGPDGALRPDSLRVVVVRL